MKIWLIIFQLILLPMLSTAEASSTSHAQLSASLSSVPMTSLSVRANDSFRQQGSQRVKPMLVLRLVQQLNRIPQKVFLAIQSLDHILSPISTLLLNYIFMPPPLA